MPSVAFGQTRTGLINKDIYYGAAINSPVGTVISDGSTLICKAGGTAWFVAPDSTQLSGTWATCCDKNASLLQGDKCCISDWGVLDTCLRNAVLSYTATEWFIPSRDRLCNPMFCCKIYWNCSDFYWSSNQQTSCALRACAGRFVYGSFIGCTCYKAPPYSIQFCIRALKCVTY
jgi:hypothetical protein